MSEIRHFTILDIEGKQALRDLLPDNLVDNFKVTLLKSYYDTEYKIDGIFKDPLLNGSKLFLYDIKTNAVHQDSLSFTICDKNGDRWKDKPKADIYIFVFREKKVAYFLTLDNVKKIVKKQFHIKGKYYFSEYVWLSCSVLKKHCSLILKDKQFMLPDGDSAPKSYTEVYNDFALVASKNENPIKKMELDKIYDGLGSLRHV